MIKMILVLQCFCLSALFSCNSKTTESSKKKIPEYSKKQTTESGKKEKPESIDLQWCDLNNKVYDAPEGSAKEAATAARKKFETEMQEKFKENQGMLDNVGKAIEDCEAASEGRK